MKSTFPTLLVILAVISMLGTLGCGTDGSNPALPSPDGLTAAGSSETGGTGVLGVYDLVFDPDTMVVELVEARQADAHYDITGWAAHHCGVSGVTWDPVTRILDFDLAINNTSVVNVFDLRVLFLSDPTSGFEMLNPDDYTKLFNPFGPDDVNPFRAYAKTAPDRIFAGGTSYTEHFTIQYPLAITLGATLLAECSWPTNCEDPYEISNQTLSNPISTTTSGTISLDAYDHQDNIGSIYVDTNPITGGLTWLTDMGGSFWTGGLFNSAGAAPGTYTCRITADSFASPDNLYDFIDIVVVPPSGPGMGWNSSDYPINGGCSMDLGVIADPGGPRDSSILMARSDMKVCDEVIEYQPYYAGWSGYMGLYDYDPTNPNYQPHPVLRIDAADDGAFSFTNENWTLPYPDAASDIYNAQVWSVFDKIPQLYTGPAPNDSRYLFNLADHDGESYPVDVCDDFELGQYSLFTTGVTYTPTDLIFLGTMPPTYTHSMLRYRANLDPWAGMGDGLVDPGSIEGIDVMAGPDWIEEEYGVGTRSVTLFVLEDSGGMYQVEVFIVVDTATGWGIDSAWHEMTINIDYFVGLDYFPNGNDIELLPINNEYDLNPNDPTLSVLVSWSMGAKDQGEVLLYNAVTGAFLEAIGTVTAPAMPDSRVHYLDTDDGDWEIHVTRTDASGNNLATVFDYS